MSQYEQESLSALIDGEADELELRRLLQKMDDDPQLAQRWQRFHLAQDVLHDRGIPVSADLAERVAQAVADEPLPAQATQQARWPQQLSRVAIAACVAIVAVVVLQPESQQELTPLAADSSAGNALANDAAVVETLVADSTSEQVDPAATRHLRDYIEAMRFDPEEPVRIEHLKDSPLYRLVNEYQARP